MPELRHFKQVFIAESAAISYDFSSSQQNTILKSIAHFGARLQLWTWRFLRKPWRQIWSLPQSVKESQGISLIASRLEWHLAFSRNHYCRTDQINEWKRVWCGLPSTKCYEGISGFSFHIANVAVTVTGDQVLVFHCCQYVKCGAQRQEDRAGQSMDESRGGRKLLIFKVTNI